MWSTVQVLGSVIKQLIHIAAPSQQGVRCYNSEQGRINHRCLLCSLVAGMRARGCQGARLAVTGDEGAPSSASVLFDSFFFFSLELYRWICHGGHCVRCIELRVYLKYVNSFISVADARLVDCPVGLAGGGGKNGRIPESSAFLYLYFTIIIIIQTHN